MSAQTFEPIAPRPAPVSTEGPVAWIRINLFGDWRTGLMTVIVLAALLALFLPKTREIISAPPIERVPA